MAAFGEPELAYLHGARRLGRLATVGKDGTPHVVPVGFTYNAEHDTIDITGRDFARTKKGASRGDWPDVQSLVWQMTRDSGRS